MVRLASASLCRLRGVRLQRKEVKIKTLNLILIFSLIVRVAGLSHPFSIIRTGYLVNGKVPCIAFYLSSPVRTITHTLTHSRSGVLGNDEWMGGWVDGWNLNSGESAARLDVGDHAFDAGDVA